MGSSAPRTMPPNTCRGAALDAEDRLLMIGAFASAPALDRRVIVDPGLLRYRDRACLRILYRCDVASTTQLTTLVYRRRQTAQERLSALYDLGYLDRAVLRPLTRGGSHLAFRVSAKGRRRLHHDSLTRLRAGTQLRHSLNVVETVCALVRASSPTEEPLVQVWFTDYMASDVLPGVYPDSIVALRTASGSAVVCLGSTSRPSTARRSATSSCATPILSPAARAGTSSSWRRVGGASTSSPASPSGTAAFQALSVGPGRSCGANCPARAFGRPWCRCSLGLDDSASARSSMVPRGAAARRQSVPMPGSRFSVTAPPKKPTRR